MPAEPLGDGSIGVFLTIMAVILVTPLLSERVHLPDIIGLILGGILVGPNGLGLLSGGRTVELLGTVGLIYLMFSAGLEVDLRQLRHVFKRAALFGLFTFALPQALGITLGRALGLSWTGAVLLGSLFGSHTLVSFPIISQMGILANESVAVAVGGTLVTNLASLLLLAIVAGIEGGRASVMGVGSLLGLVGVYVVLVLWGLPQLGKWFFRRFTSRSVEFQFVLFALFVAALLAELIGMQAIVGAFLAGLAINSSLPGRSAVIGQVLFVGESFFIPIFCMHIGMISNPRAIVAHPEALWLGLAFAGCVYVSKLAAAWLTARAFHYSRDEMLTMWGLSQAQAAEALAFILVATGLGLFPSVFFDAGILLILVTCATSPILVQRFAPALTVAPSTTEQRSLFDRILVPIANPTTQAHLINLAGILASSVEGVLMPLHVAQETRGRVTGLDHQKELLDRVPDVLDDPRVRLQILRRVDTSVAGGIVREAIQNDASLIVVGWRGRRKASESILGTVLDEVVWQAPIPVLVGRITMSMNAIRRVMVIVAAHGAAVHLAAQTVDMAIAIARAINVPLLILSAAGYLTEVQCQLDQKEHPCELASLGGNVIQDAKTHARPDDLVIVTTIGPRTRFRSSLGYIPEHLANTIPSSLAVIHYP